MSAVALHALAAAKAAAAFEAEKASLPPLVAELTGERMEAYGRVVEGKAELLKSKQDQNDVYFFLHKKLDDNYDIISGMENQLLSESLDRKNAVEGYRKTIDEDQLSYDEVMTQLRNRQGEIDEKLFSLKEVGSYKEEIEGEMRKLLNEIEGERKSHFKNIAELERKAVKDKEILKQRLIDGLKAAKIELEGKSHQMLIQTSAQAKVDHRTYAYNLGSHGTKAGKVLKASVDLQGDVLKAKHELEICGEIASSMKEREGNFQKVIAGLTQTLQNLGDDLETEIREEENDADEFELQQHSYGGGDLKSIEEESTLDAIRELEGSLVASKENLEAVAERAEDAAAEYEIEVVCQRELQNFLSTCLSDTREQARIIKSRGGLLEGWSEDRIWGPNVLIPPRLNELSLAQRRGVFKFLLGEVHGYKIRVEAALVGEAAAKRVADEQQRLREGRGKRKDGAGGFEQQLMQPQSRAADPSISLRTGIDSWDNYDAKSSFLGNLLSVSTVGDRTPVNAGVQTDEVKERGDGSSQMGSRSRSRSRSLNRSRQKKSFKRFEETAEGSRTFGGGWGEDGVGGGEDELSRMIGNFMTVSSSASSVNSSVQSSVTGGVIKQGRTAGRRIVEVYNSSSIR
jgi:hypothetical protein